MNKIMNRIKSKLMSKTFFTLVFLLSLIFCSSADAVINDNLVDTTLKGRELENPYKDYKYNYLDTKKIPIQLSVIADINSEKDIVEGQTVVFRVQNDVWYNRQKIIKKDDLVQAKAQTVITSGMNGIPASIIFGDFKFENIEQSKIKADFEKFGLDRSFWVYPLKWALTPLPPTGSLTNFIKGGHAKLKTDEIVTVYFYPNW